MDFAPRGEPMDETFLAQYGLTEDDTARLIDEGWLRYLSQGAYLLRGDSPTVDGTVAFFARKTPGLHVSGRAALDMQGIRYSLLARVRINLWGDTPQRFPTWASDLLLLTYQHERLFDEQLRAGFAISILPARHPRMPVSVPERAVLEYLAGSVQNEMLREDNANLVGMMRNLRLNVLQQLVDHCVRRDVVWALKFFGEDENFAWATKLEC
ncbi:AbiEi antitoxin N-terminal domain-containing protein [Caballeronia sp. LZ029]|nr:AbiEi antitoxin N-terminal domain-containing protein [Caballeronia sp. LZ029]MDR5746987.1 AbiEi antitoxin N-terminal domain-containing protein [Caballeronia sp. LZ029]